MRVRRGLARAMLAVAVAAGAGIAPMMAANAAVATFPAPSGLWPPPPPPQSTYDVPQYKNLELRWHDTGASAYLVELTDDGTYAEGHVLRATTRLPRWSPPTTIPAGSYRWHVKALYPGGSSAWAASSFVRGWDAAPANPQADTSAAAPTFSWSPLTDASFYEVEISDINVDQQQPPMAGTWRHSTCYTNHTFLSLYGVVAGTENTPGDEGNCPTSVTADSADMSGQTLPNPLPPGTYYWRVRGRDATVDARKQPFADPAVACTGVWYTVDSQDGKVQLPEAPPDYLAKPECSAWSAMHPFTISAPTATSGVSGPPANLRVYPTTGDPAAVTVDTTDTPRFAWDAVPGTAKYRLYLSRTPDMRDAFRIYETQATSLQPVDSLGDRSLPLYWIVQACGTDTCSPVPDDPRQPHAFTRTTALTVTPDGLSRHGKALIMPWTVRQAGSVDVAAYEVQVASTYTGFSTPVLDRTVDRRADRGDQAHGHLTVDYGDFAVGPYQWRIRPIDMSGNALPWGPVKSFSYGRVVGAGTVDSASSALLHNASWGVHHASDAVGASYLANGNAGASSSLMFDGTGVSVLACKGPKYGELEVIVDGVTRAITSLAQDWSSCRHTVWTSPVLPHGVHTVELRVMDDGPVGVDALVVR